MCAYETENGELRAAWRETRRLHDYQGDIVNANMTNVIKKILRVILYLLDWVHQRGTLERATEDWQFSQTRSALLEPCSPYEEQAYDDEQADDLL